MKFVIVFLAVLGCALADRQSCPHPSDAGNQVLNERISLAAPLQGREELELDVAESVTRQEVTCAAVVSSGAQGGPAVISLGRNARGGLSVKVISGERAPLDLIISAYVAGNPNPNTTPNPNPNPNPNPTPNPNPNPTPNPNPNPNPTPNPNPNPVPKFRFL